MKYFLKTACILLLSISFIHSTYSQTLSLQSLKKQKYGLGFAYNQTEFENWSRGVDATDHNAHLVVPIRLSDFSKLSIMPCIIIRNEKNEKNEKNETSVDPNSVDPNVGCYIRYTKLHSDATIPFFYRLGGGGNSNDSDTTESLTWMWKGHIGGGIFWDLKKSRGVPLKLFSGLFIQGEFERRIEESEIYNDWGLDLSAEFGVEINFSEKQSLSITGVTYLFNTNEVSTLYPKFYFSLRIL